MNAWIDFLKKFGIWSLEQPIRDLVYSNKEKLIAAIKLREEQIILNNQVPEDNIAVSITWLNYLMKIEGKKTFTFQLHPRLHS